MESLRIETCFGPQILSYLTELARLRISVFRDWPYLYEGNLDYEEDYLKTFAKAKGAVLVLVFDGQKVVGASTGLPLACETQNIQEPFRQAGFEGKKTFYFAESVLEKNYRGLGLGVRFFEEREQWARSLGFETAAFCGVVRPTDHPMRPNGFVPLDDFWRKRGFEPVDGLFCQIHWRDLNETVETAKSLQCWIKRL